MYKKTKIGKVVTFTIGLIIVSLGFGFVGFGQPGRPYAPNSVLASGTWFQIAVNQTNVYRIDADLLRSAGISVVGLNPDNVRLYGFGGNPLPQANAILRPDDLPELPLLPVGMEDGRFDPGDYFLFYGEAATVPHYDSTQKRFYHETNPYRTNTSYLVGVNAVFSAPPKRITSKSVQHKAQLRPFTPAYLWHEVDKFNIGRCGRVWFGDLFDFQTKYTYTLDVPGSIPATRAWITIRVAGRSPESTSFRVVINGQTFSPISCMPVWTSDPNAVQADVVEARYEVAASSRYVVELEYLKGSNAAKGWLDFIALEYNRNFEGNAYPVYLFPSDGQYQTLPTTNTVWDVTNRYQVQHYLPHDNAVTVEVDTFRCYFVFNGTGQRPGFIKSIPNQNLHALPQADYFIITLPEFIGEAKRLAELHKQHYGYSHNIVTVEQIYNEFAAGNLDVTAIRDFLKVFYDRAGEDSVKRPKYLLLFGDGDYDYRSLISKPRNKVPVYSARESLSPPSGYAADDFFTLLETHEGQWREGSMLLRDDTPRRFETLDMAVGRMPVSNLKEARAAVDKIIRYHDPNVNLGDWRNRFLLVGDYKDGETNHITEAESQYQKNIAPQVPCAEVLKVYLDAFPAQKLAEGVRYPEARQAFKDAVNDGALIVNYVGHGGETGLSNSYIMEIPDIEQLNNTNALSFWITATCDFGRTDDVERVSGGERLFLNPNGGAIGLLTSVRAVYSAGNFLFNDNFYEAAFAIDATTGLRRAIGEVCRLAKNKTYPRVDINTRNFTLIGDPGIRLNFPTYSAKITTFNNHPVTKQDTIRALQPVFLGGEILNTTGQLAQNFNGTANIAVYDKPQQRRTLTRNLPYSIQNNLLFNGKVSVKNGRFNIRFTTPLDIDYQPGFGKVSVYAVEADKDASGCSKELVVCCTDTLALQRPNTPPEVRLTLDDDRWQPCGYTSNQPTLIVRLSDDTGINSTGLGIGRELTAVLNGNNLNPIILNRFYTADLNQPNRGTIRLPLRGLKPGTHHLMVKVWDVNNASATAEICFKIAKPDELITENLQFFPNPCPAGSTLNLRFSHNRANTPLSIETNFFTMTGQIAYKTSLTIAAPSTQIDPILITTDSLSAGLYLVRVNIKDLTTGIETQKTTKIVLN